MSSIQHDHSHRPPLQHMEGMTSRHHHYHHHQEEEQQQVPHLIPFFPLYDPPSPFSFSSSPSSQQYVHHRLIHQDEESSHSDGSSDPLLFVVSLPAKDSEKLADCYAQKSNGAAKWMSSKMRLMRKMMSPSDARKAARRSAPPLDDPQQPVRVCSDCNTTKSPLWRSGPQGPKSLCNACGIRRRKARKAAAAAASAAPVQGPQVVVKKEDGGGDHGPIVPFKKRCKFVTAGTAEEPALWLGQKTFPEEVKEAAILLMALSCGTLVCR